MKEKKVKFVSEASKEQIAWGSNDDPNKLLKLNKTYVLENKEVHSWHTKLYLKKFPGKKFPGKKFNSVNFEEL